MSEKFEIKRVTISTKILNFYLSINNISLLDEFDIVDEKIINDFMRKCNLLHRFISVEELKLIEKNEETILKEMNKYDNISLSKGDKNKLRFKFSLKTNASHNACLVFLFQKEKKYNDGFEKENKLKRKMRWDFNHQSLVELQSNQYLIIDLLKEQLGLSNKEVLEKKSIIFDEIYNKKLSIKDIGILQEEMLIILGSRFDKHESELYVMKNSK